MDMYKEQKKLVSELRKDLAEAKKQLEQCNQLSPMSEPTTARPQAASEKAPHYQHQQASPPPPVPTITTTTTTTTLARGQPAQEASETATKIWNSYGLTDTILGDNGSYIFRFCTSHEAENVLTNGPWNLAGHPFSLKKWSLQLPPHQSTASCIPIWVKFFNIPTHYWTATGLSHIASSVGVPLYANQATVSRTKLKYARICVDIDISQPLLTEVELIMEDDTIERIGIEYQWLPKICKRCNKLNHTEFSCPLNVTEHTPARDNSPPPKSPSNDWITVRKRRRQPGNKAPTNDSHTNNRFSPLLQANHDTNPHQSS
ncbi:uncharacterized protein LOC132280938 [Cornus florida]|uniref:uncharacterized protein LOC132280938 n=1 Tax=Cornus florida TaxID=4283 RepID=UPI002896971D|nr:uncharacterized protein LOC132280938 [Cornus florida]